MSPGEDFFKSSNLFIKVLKNKVLLYQVSRITLSPNKINQVSNVDDSLLPEGRDPNRYKKRPKPPGELRVTEEANSVNLPGPIVFADILVISYS